MENLTLRGAQVAVIRSALLASKSILEQLCDAGHSAYIELREVEDALRILDSNPV